jgi:hypothetical protein
MITSMLPRVSVPVTLTYAQQEAILHLAESLHVLVTPTTESDVIRIALRDLWAKHNPPAVANPFLEE